MQFWQDRIPVPVPTPNTPQYPPDCTACLTHPHMVREAIRGGVEKTARHLAPVDLQAQRDPARGVPARRSFSFDSSNLSAGWMLSKKTKGRSLQVNMLILVQYLRKLRVPVSEKFSDAPARKRVVRDILAPSVVCFCCYFAQN